MAQGAVAGGRPTVARRVAVAPAVALTVLAVALAGCGGPAPEPSPTSTSSSPSPTPTDTSPAPTPAPTPPPKPAAWASNDDAGALAAAQYFMDLYNYVIATGDLTEWKALSGAECEFCTNVAASVGELYASGGHYQGGLLKTSDASYVRFDESAGVHVVTLRYETQLLKRVDSSGSLVNTTAEEAGAATLDLRSVESGWQLSVVTSQTVTP